MAQTIAIINQKGGVGKSTTAHALGAGLKQRGSRVLFVDEDAQANLTFATGANKAGVTLYDVLSRRAGAEQAIQRTEQGDVLAAGAALAAEDLLPGTGREYKLREALATIDSLYDYIVIDCPPSLGILTINALTAADKAIVPVQADVFSLQAIDQFKTTFDAVKKYTNPRIEIAGLLITRYSGRAVLSRDLADMIADTAQQLGTKVFTAVIRECIALKEAQARRTDIFTYAPKSNAAADYNQFIDEVLSNG